MTIVKIILNLYAKHIDKGWWVPLISYKPFWQTLKNKNISTYTLITKYNISSATIDRMKKGNGISTMKIDDLCKILDCSVSEIIEYIKD